MPKIQAEFDSLKALYDALKNDVQYANDIQKQTDSALANAVWESTNATNFRAAWEEFKPKLMAFEQTFADGANDVANNYNNLIIANGADPRNIVRAAQGCEVGTLFLAGKNRINSRKYWLAYSAADKGLVAIDAGAARALKEGKSLLAVGIREVAGEFERGETLAIKDASGLALARGITNYSSAELALIKGRKSEDIEAVLGYKYEDEALHIDNIALI